MSTKMSVIFFVLIVGRKQMSDYTWVLVHILIEKMFWSSYSVKKLKCIYSYALVQIEPDEIE